MDYEFFSSLSDDEAGAYLARFRELEGQEVEKLVSRARADGVHTDFALRSIPGFLTWLRPSVQVVAVDPPDDVEPWIERAMVEHHGGFLDLGDESRPLVLRAAFYLGESFVRSHPQLRWGVGRDDRAEYQQPVVTGFRTDADLPALEVAENLFLGPSREDPGFEVRVQGAVEIWTKAI